MQIKKASDLKSYLKYIKNHSFGVNKNILFSLVERFSNSNTITYLCKILEVSRSGYYKWKKRPHNKEGVSEYKKKIINNIKKIQKLHEERLGYRRMYDELVKIMDLKYAPITIYRIMKRFSLMSTALYTKKNVIINRAIHKYENQLKGNFEAFQPNMKWCIDLTKIKCSAGNLNMCAVIDLYDRSIVSYKIWNSQMTRLVTSTINDALNKENISNATPLLIHSDQGTQFSSGTYKRFAKEKQFKASMSEKGSPTSNACIESFFATLKNECLKRHRFSIKEVAKKYAEDFVEYYNNIRPQGRTSMTPMQLRNLAA